MKEGVKVFWSAIADEYERLAEMKHYSHYTCYDIQWLVRAAARRANGQCQYWYATMDLMPIWRTIGYRGTEPVGPVAYVWDTSFTYEERKANESRRSDFCWHMAETIREAIGE